MQTYERFAAFEELSHDPCAGGASATHAVSAADVRLDLKSDRMMPTKGEHRVLVADDERSIRTLLESALTSVGYHVTSAPDAERALSLSRSNTFDAAIVDIRMPGMDGIELSRCLQGIAPDLPVILITGYPGVDTAREAMQLGACDYISKPFNIEDLGLSVARAIERRSGLTKERAHQQGLEAKVRDHTQQISDALRSVERSCHEIDQAHLESIIVLSRVAEQNEEYSTNHVRRVGSYCAEMARELKCSDEFIERITYSALMHDIGKLAVPSRVLTKPGKLTDDEFELIKRHPVEGARILEGIPFLAMAKEIALTHHERCDGSGYPYGLAGDEIPLSGRIAAVADVFDALISHRPYKEAWSFWVALNTLSREAGKHFDPRVLGAFLARSKRIRGIAARLNDENAPGDRGRSLTPVGVGAA